jgi:hypothetical protein
MRPEKKNLGKNSDKTKKIALQKKPCQGRKPPQRKKPPPEGSGFAIMVIKVWTTWK